MQKEYTVDKKRLGAELRLLRKERKMTQTHAGKQVGLSYVTLVRLETGQSEMTLSTLCKLSNLYQEPPLSILGKIIKASEI